MLPHPALTGLGWDPAWEAAFAPFAAAGRLPARVVVAHRDAWIVAGTGPGPKPGTGPRPKPGTGGGADGSGASDGSGDRDAVISGRFRHETLGPGDLPAVGDWVAISNTDPAVISAVLPRRSAFGRNRDDGQVAADQVLAANVDVAFVVAGLDGDFNPRRIERYLAVAWSGNTTPVILLNKADTTHDLDSLRIAAEAVAPGVEVRAVSARSGHGIDDLRRDILTPGRTAVLLGSSGVGKSTLVNALLGEARQRTGAVREADSRGHHTTRHRELVRLP
ncbi:MAG: GTPase RsgA, partial [Chloroflexota bacterium]